MEADLSLVLFPPRYRVVRILNMVGEIFMLK